MRSPSNVVLSRESGVVAEYSPNEGPVSASRWPVEPGGALPCTSSFTVVPLARRKLKPSPQWIRATASFSAHAADSHITDVDNHAETRLLERVGFRREAHLVDNIWFQRAWASEYLYAVLADEWASKMSRR